MQSEPLPAISPRADLVAGLCWIAFGLAVLALAWRMDRFESQGGTLYTAPGLWPGLLGVLIAALGGVLILRAVHRARAAGWCAKVPATVDVVPVSRFLFAASLMFAYALVLVAHGLPFWLGTAIFVTTFVFLFRRYDGHPVDARAMLLSLACGLATAWIVVLTFEKLFYVRLP